MQQVTRKGNPSLGLSTCGSLKACVEKKSLYQTKKKWNQTQTQKAELCVGSSPNQF